MHNNYYFLKQLCLELDNKLKGSVISACFSQNKDELIIRFETHTVPFFIKASLLSNFSCLSFPDNFSRARKNSADLFESLIGQRVISVKQFKNERSFALNFENYFSLLFKMHGNRANIILFENRNVIELFKNSIQTDKEIDLTMLDRVIDWSYENFVANQDKLNQTYFTFGKVVWEYLNENNFQSKTIEGKWHAFHDVINLLEKPKFYNTEIKNTLALSLLPYGNIQKVHVTPIKAITDFYYAFTQTFALTKERTAAVSNLRSQFQNSQHYFDKTSVKLTELKNENNYKVLADLIMANMHLILPRTEKVTLQNFYTNQPVEIKLKRDQSPQKNAESYYRKSKNQQIEESRLQQALDIKEKELVDLTEKIQALEKAADLKTLRSLVIKFGLHVQKEKQLEPLPYHEFEFNGYRIWVGRNAQSNDSLTLKYTFKEDLWLHAKDVLGSHVVVKYQAGKVFPKDVIERAAQLAAYHSKRKNESLCPVVVTPKKFVRKRKGDPAGMVIVEREEVIMVEPKK